MTASCMLCIGIQHQQHEYYYYYMSCMISPTFVYILRIRYIITPYPHLFPHLLPHLFPHLYQAKVLEEARLLLTDTHARLDLMQASCCSQEDAVRAWLAAADASLSTPADVVAGDVEAVAA